MTSVIIPAHDEERVIGRCLRAILNSSHRPTEVIVVCNGCTDRTAEVARNLGSAVRVIEIHQASKTLALNVGDREASSFPRFFVDADVLLSPNALQEVSAALETAEARIAAPRMSLVFDEHPWSVRAYFAIWTRLPYYQSGVIGSGVYAVSQAGRERFGRFPEIIADDEFVRAFFSSRETQVVESCFFQVFPPRSLREVVHVKTRFHKGNLELRRRFPGLGANLRRRYGAALGGLIRAPGLWPGLAVYVLVYTLSRTLAEWKLRRGDLGWERDEGSRSGAALEIRRDGTSRPGVGSSGRSG